MLTKENIVDRRLTQSRLFLSCSLAASSVLRYFIEIDFLNLSKFGF